MASVPRSGKATISTFLMLLAMSIPAPPVTTEHTTHQDPPEFPTEETQPQVNDSPTPAPELDSQSNPTEESALQGGQ